MDYNLDLVFDNFDEDEAEERRERQLLADEVPVAAEGDDDCGDACKI